MQSSKTKPKQRSMSEIKKLLSKLQKTRKSPTKAKDSFSASDLSCSFCNRVVRDSFIIQGSKANICGICVNICQKLLEKNTDIAKGSE